MFAQGEDIMYRHSEDREYTMPPDIDYMPWVQPASSSVSLSPSLASLPTPVGATSCFVVTGKEFVPLLDGWRHSQGYSATPQECWENVLSCVPWNGLPWLYCQPLLNFRFWSIFQGGVETCRNSSFLPPISLTGIYCFHFARALASVDPLLVSKVRRGKLHSLMTPALTSSCAPTTGSVPFLTFSSTHQQRNGKTVERNLFKGSVQTNNNRTATISWWAEK